MRLTFGEQLEINAKRDEIVEAMNQGGEYWDKIVMFKLRSISKISYEAADKVLKDLKLEKHGFKPVNKKGRNED